MKVFFSLFLIILFSIQPPPILAVQPEVEKVGQNGEDVSQEKQHSSKQKVETDKTKIPAISESFDPSEKISEDLSVPFPVDI